MRSFLASFLMVIGSACAQSTPLAKDAPESPGSNPSIALERCNGDAWCFAHGAPIHSVHGAGDAVFAVGAQGLVLEWTEAGWQQHTAFTGADLDDVWVSAANDVWVSDADANVFRYDGDSWSALPVKGRSLTGTAPDDLWLDTLHYDGTAFRDLPPDLEFMANLIVVGRNDAWAIGVPRAQAMVEPGRWVVMHYVGDRGGWIQAGEPLGEPFSYGSLVNVHGEAWVYGPHEVFRFDGSRWVLVPDALAEGGGWRAPPGSPSDGLVMLAGDDFLVAPMDTACFTAYRAQPDHAFCVNRNGAVFHFDGEAWAPTSHDPFGATLSAEDWGKFPPALWASNATLAWGSSPTNVFRARPVPAPDMFAGAVSAVEHYDGTTWTELARGYVADITGSAADDVWVAGEQLLHYDGRTLEPVALPAELGKVTVTDVHSFGPRAVWIIAQRYLESTSLLLRYDGEWSVEKMESTGGLEGIELDAITGTSEGGLWVVATRNPVSRSPGTGILYHQTGRGDWDALDLWPTWGFRQLASAGDRLWLSDSGGLYELSAAAIATATQPMSEPPINISSPIGPGNLWVGTTDLWMTNADQAAHRTR